MNINNEKMAHLAVKLMKQKKVKARMTPSKSWTTLRRKRDQKR
ncbi:hypothetical protein T4E_8765 [Trichinella pseudospiralis]|uniref:Uncharacterized protein n=1 Tax=Trichinella pseudospiralis TaxID=6337 RepID=A0A0V0Y6V2_TRIPS|nr:hypothetical protein T4E_8765 [Trichinella pseudospiralis]